MLNSNNNDANKLSFICFAVKAIRHTITAHGERTSEGNYIQNK